MTETELRMTDHELLAILSMTPTESAAVARDLLRLEQHGENELLLNAGLTTLLVRGFAEPQAEKIVPVGKCAVVASVLSQAQEWLEVSLTTPTSEHVLFAVGSNVGAILMSINPLGTHEIQPIESGPAMLTLGMHLCSQYLEGAAEGLPATAAVRRVRLGADTVAAELTAGESGNWVFSVGTDVGPAEESIPAEVAMARFKAALEL